MNRRSVKSLIGSRIIPALPISREAFDLLRLEWNAAWVRFGCTVNPVKRARIKKICSAADLSVNLGAGPFGHEGWVNIDIFKAKNIAFTWDCRKHLPFKTNSVDRIRCEHVLEHMDRVEEVPRFLKECFRCLKAGAVLRIVVPDAEKFIKAYAENTAASWKEVDVDIASFSDEWQPMDAMNKIFHQAGEHKFGYDFPTLKLSLKKAGFSEIQKLSFGLSVDPKLNQDQQVHQHASLYVDCVKI